PPHLARSACTLTILLSGPPRCHFRTGEHAIHCDHGSATRIARPLQCVVSCHVVRPRSRTLRLVSTVCVGRQILSTVDSRRGTKTNHHRRDGYPAPRFH